MHTIVLIDYGSGNLRSAAKAFERVAEGNHHVMISADAANVQKASHIVLPGVGAFADCMAGLQKIPGMIQALEKQVLVHKKPFLGICVGMQMLFETGFEHGEHKGLGWLEGKVVKLDSSMQRKIPHMGWNDVIFQKPDNKLFANIASGEHFYFVHSYHAQCVHAEEVIATVKYGEALTAAVARGNIMGTQFHPEKSQEAGLGVLRNFLNFPAMH